MTESDFFLFLALFAYKTTGIFHQNMTMIFSAPEPKAQVCFCDHMLSVINFFDLSTTAEQISTKLDKKQDLNVLYKVCVFG